MGKKFTPDPLGTCPLEGYPVAGVPEVAIESVRYIPQGSYTKRNPVWRVAMRDNCSMEPEDSQLELAADFQNFPVPESVLCLLGGQAKLGKALESWG